MSFGSESNQKDTLTLCQTYVESSLYTGTVGTVLLYKQSSGLGVWDVRILVSAKRFGIVATDADTEDLSLVS